MPFTIVAENCTGCTACEKRCPTRAISGDPRIRRRLCRARGHVGDKSRVADEHPIVPSVQRAAGVVKPIHTCGS